MSKVRKIGQLLRSFEKHADDTMLNMSLTDLIEKYNSELDDEQKKQDENDIKVANKYENKYLKIFPEDIFGKELKVIHITKLTPDGYDTDYNRIYEMSGTYISFCDTGRVYSNTYENDTQSTISVSELEQYTFISKDEYDAYMEEYSTINCSLQRILRDGVVLDNDSDKLNWPEVLTWKTEYSIEEQKENLTQLINFVKREEQHHPYLKENRIIWEKQLKQLKDE